MANIAAHLQKGLVSWLLGAAAKAGLQLPERFDIKGILALIASLLGLTWAAIRGRVVSKGVPEQAMGAVESSVPMAQKIQSEGIGGIWEQLKDKVGDLKTTLLGKIAQYLIPTVIIAGITWIVSLLNPASAFIKACKAIIDIVTFIVERGAQIMTFVNAVLDAVIVIAGGGAGGVPGLIETALATALPVLIGFLAALLGIGGLADKVKKLFQSLSKPVMKAVDWIVGKIAAFGKKLWAKLRAKLGGKGREETPEDKAHRLKQGMAAAAAAVKRFSGRSVGRAVLGPVLSAIRLRYRMTVLEPREHDGRWAIRGVVNPEAEKVTDLVISADMKTIDLSGDWRSTQFTSGQSGIVYVLRDKNTGEKLKVGKTEPGTFVGRFEKYATAARQQERELVVDTFTVPKGGGKTIEAIEAEVRRGVGAIGGPLPWDNTQGRLGRVGPGVPGTRLPRRLRQQGYRWEGNKLIKD